MTEKIAKCLYKLSKNDFTRNRPKSNKSPNLVTLAVTYKKISAQSAFTNLRSFSKWPSDIACSASSKASIVSLTSVLSHKMMLVAKMCIVPYLGAKNDHSSGIIKRLFVKCFYQLAWVVGLWQMLASDPFNGCFIALEYTRRWMFLQAEPANKWYRGRHSFFSVHHRWAPHMRRSSIGVCWICEHACRYLNWLWSWAWLWTCV